MTDTFVNATCCELSTLVLFQKNKCSADSTAESLCSFEACKVSSTSGSTYFVRKLRFLVTSDVPRNSVFHTMIAQYFSVALKESTSSEAFVKFFAFFHVSYFDFLSRGAVAID
jgi:hypothetical protein